MGRFSRRKAVPHLAYAEPLFAVCYRNPKTDEIEIADKRGPAVRKMAQYYADLVNEFSDKTGRVAVLCPISHMIIDESPLDGLPSVVVLEPSGQIVERGPWDECKSIADECNRLDDLDPTGQRAIVRPVVKRSKFRRRAGVKGGK